MFNFLKVFTGFAHMFTIVSSHLLAKSIKRKESWDEKACHLEYNTFIRRILRDRCTGSVPLTPPEAYLKRKSLRGYQKILQAVKYPLAIIILILLTVIFF